LLVRLYWDREWEEEEEGYEGYEGEGWSFNGWGF
jgi:hypothetical protein